MAAGVVAAWAAGLGGGARGADAREVFIEGWFRGERLLGEVEAFGAVGRASD